MKRLRPGYSQFYVYEHWRPDKNVCFYVGKGHKKRAYNFVNNRNRSYLKIVKELSKAGLVVQVVFWKTGLLESDSLALEVERIAYWRALGVELVNRTNGGDGVSGYYPTAEARAKHSAHIKLLYLQNPMLRESNRARAKGNTYLKDWYARGNRPVRTVEQLESTSKAISKALTGKVHKDSFEYRASDDLKTEIIVAYINGVTMEAICNKHHCDNVPIKKWLTEAGVPIRGRYGQSPTLETRLKIKAKLTGRTRESPSNETRALLSIAVSAALAAKKAAGLPRYQPGNGTFKSNQNGS